MSTLGGPKLVTSRLILSLDAADKISYPGSGTAWNDLSGNGYNATAINSPSFLNEKNGVMSFDGVNSRYETGYSTVTNPFGNNSTWEAWASCTQSVNTYNMFMGAFLPYFSFYGGNYVYFSNYIGNTQRSINTAANSITLGVWYHMCFTCEYDTGANSTTMKIFLNGSLGAQNSFSGAQTTTGATKFSVGDGMGATWYPFQGKVSNVRIYNRTLSASEILQNFNALRGRFGI